MGTIILKASGQGTEGSQQSFRSGSILDIILVGTVEWFYQNECKVILINS